MKPVIWSGQLLLSILVFICLDEVNTLECYVCTTQEGNTEKCLSTTKTCETEETVCQSEVRWGSTPYWSQGAEKQYYVTKKCARKSECKQLVDKFLPDCHRIWYEDWKCGECCEGDRCNYYIVMGAGNLRTTWVMYAIPALAVILHAF